MSAASDSNLAARGLSIGQRLTLIVLAVAIPMLLLSAAIVWLFAGQARDQRRDAIMYSSRTIMSAVDAQLGKYMAAVQALAVSFRTCRSSRTIPSIGGSCGITVPATSVAASLAATACAGRITARTSTVPISAAKRRERTLLVSNRRRHPPAP